MRHVIIDTFAQKAWAFKRKEEALARLRILIAKEIDKSWCMYEHPDGGRSVTRNETHLIPDEALGEISPNTFMVEEGELGVWSGFDTAGRESTGGSWPEKENLIRWDGFLHYATHKAEDAMEVEGSDDIEAARPRVNLDLGELEE